MVEAIHLSRSSHKRVHFNFNAIPLVVHEGTIPGIVIDDYHRATEAQAIAYSNSPEGKAEAARYTQEIKAKQCRMDDLVGAPLSVALKGGLTPTIVWIREYASIADHIGINHYGREVYGMLQSAGYEADAFVGDKFIKGDKECMGRYLVGQVMSCLKGAMPPHPIAVDFADQYLAMPDKGSTPKTPNGP